LGSTEKKSTEKGKKVWHEGQKKEGGVRLGRNHHTKGAKQKKDGGGRGKKTQPK